MYDVKFSEISEKQTKKTLKLRKGRLGLIISFVLFLALDLILMTEYKARGVSAVGYQFMEKVAEVFDSATNIASSLWEPNLKQEDNLTSALIVGVDTRNAEFTGTEFVNPVDPEDHVCNVNADVVMQVVYDHTNGNVFLISIPRDMGVDVRKECLEFHGSLHWVYYKGQKADCPGGGEQTLIETVEGVTGIPIQYYAVISFEVFEDIIDAVGETNEDGEKGIWIDLDSPVYELYPLEDGGWESIYFPPGHQFLTSERALKFARSRKASSDFARARRQQIVVEAVKNRVMSSETLLDPKKISSLIKTFKQNAIFSEPNLEEIRAALNVARDLDESEIVNVILDYELGGHEVYLNRQPHDRLTALYYMVPTHWKECPGNEFCRIKEFIRKIMRNPEVYEEGAKVVVYARSYSYSGKPNFSNSLYQSFKNNGLPLSVTESKYVANIDSDEGIVILDFSEGAKEKTLGVLADEFGTDITPGSEYPYVRINKEDIAIVVKGD